MRLLFRKTSAHPIFVNGENLAKFARRSLSNSSCLFQRQDRKNRLQNAIENLKKSQTDRFKQRYNLSQRLREREYLGHEFMNYRPFTVEYEIKGT